MQPRLRWPVLFSFVLLAACALVRAPTAEELALLESPPSEVRRLQDLLVPPALQWLDETEAELLSKGRSLLEEETTMARTVGVEYPERVRVIECRHYSLDRTRYVGAASCPRVPARGVLRV